MERLIGYLDEVIIAYSTGFFIVTFLGVGVVTALHLLTGSVGWEEFGLIPFCIGAFPFSETTEPILATHRISV